MIYLGRLVMRDIEPRRLASRRIRHLTPLVVP
jgi:hypothetical protein